MTSPTTAQLQDSLLCDCCCLNFVPFEIDQPRDEPEILELMYIESRRFGFAFPFGPCSLPLTLNCCAQREGFLCLNLCCIPWHLPCCLFFDPIWCISLTLARFSLRGSCYWCCCQDEDICWYRDTYKKSFTIPSPEPTRVGSAYELHEWYYIDSEKTQIHDCDPLCFFVGKSTMKAKWRVSSRVLHRTVPPPQE